MSIPDPWGPAVNSIPDDHEPLEKKEDGADMKISSTIFLSGFALEVHLIIILFILKWLTPWL